jgi:hypothetical protein
MTVAINSTRKTVEINWNPNGGGSEPSPPEGYPEHPIYLPPYVDNTLPEPEQPVDPDYGVDEGAHPDHELPGPQPHPEHPIYLPPYVDNSLPGRGSAGGEHPDHELPEVPPEGIEGVPPETIEKIKDFLFGNLPPFSGGPEYVAPVSTGVEAVQVFAQGQDGDWSNTAVMPNDGLAALVYPQNFTGESYVEVRALDGTLVDCGTITVS